MNNKIISRHLSWAEKGLNFEDICAIRAELKKRHPGIKIGTEIIQQRIGAKDPDMNFEKSDLEKLKFLLIEDPDFEGDLQFLQYSKNLEVLSINGLTSKKKISNLDPLSGLHKLQEIHMAHHVIEDISPLEHLKDLRKVDLYDNKLKSIAPLTQQKNLHKARFSGVNENEIKRLLQSSNRAIVTFNPQGIELIFQAFWVNDWAFKACYKIEKDHLAVSIEPVKDEEGRLPLLTAPDNLRGVILRAKELVGELMENTPDLSNSHFSFIEKTNVLKGSLYFHGPLPAEELHAHINQYN